MKAERGISNNPAPLPLNTDADTLPLIKAEPLNSIVTDEVDSTLKNPASSTEAVTEPVAINGATNAGTFVNWEPSPIKNCALTLPLTSIEPVNSEP